MTNTYIEDQVFRSDLFALEPLSSKGEADGLPTIGEVTADHELQHPNWSSEKAGRQLVGMEVDRTSAVANYGYRVFRDLTEEPEPMDEVYLDPRCFLRETNLLDVLEEAARTALDYDRGDLVLPIVKGMISTAQTENFAG